MMQPPLPLDRRFAAQSSQLHRFASAPAARPGYCMECGSALRPGHAFCMECGTRAGAVGISGPARSHGCAGLNGSVHADQQHGIAVGQQPMMVPGFQQGADRGMRPAYPAAVIPVPMQSQSGGNGGIILMGVLLMVAAIIVLIGVLLFTQDGSGTGEEPIPAPSMVEEAAMPEEEGAPEEEPVAVHLDKSYVTDDQTLRAQAYPVFSFSYPSGWSARDGVLGEDIDSVEISTNSWDAISYMMASDAVSQPYTVRIGSIEKVADCALDLGSVSSDSAMGRQGFAVVGFSIRSSDSPMMQAGDDVIAVLPESVIDDPSSIDFSTGLPGFECGMHIAFAMVHDPDAVLERRVQEAAAILGSLRFVKEVPASDMDVLRRSSSSARTAASDQVIPFSGTALLIEDDIAGLSVYELYLARNEIYARHGREFANEDLREHFMATSWYEPMVAAEDFTDDMLSQIERDNLQLILAREQSLGSPYIL